LKALKKLIAGIFALTIVFAMMTAKDSMRVSADTVGTAAIVMTADEDSCDWDYTEDSKGELIILRYTGNSDRICVPSEIGGKKVRKIGRNAFNSCIIRELTVPEGITAIGDGAFRGICGLKEMKLPESITAIGEGAFEKSSVEKINIPSAVKTISRGAFENSCVSEIEFAEGLRNIGEDAFKGCGKLFSAELPSTVTYIGPGAFKGSAIEIMNIPIGVTEITESAFEDSALSYIVIPETVESIRTKAFSGCHEIRAVTFPGSLKTIGDGAFEYSGIVKAEIPASVEYIGNAVYLGSNLEELTLKGVPEMANGAFNFCTKLKNINVDTEAEFDGSVFYGCLDLMRINGFTVNGKGSKGQPFFNGVIKDLVLRNFRGTRDVGFINSYLMDEIHYIISQTVTDDMSEVEKVTALQKWVCDNVAYNWDDYTAASNYVDSSVFLNEFTVCDGYARGMALLLQEAGFEVYYVANNIHAWDVVKVGDHYFHIDATYADAFSKGISYKRFLSNDERNYEYNNYWELRKPSSLFKYDADTELPESPYSSGDVNMDGSVDDADYEYLCMYLNGDIEIAKGDEILADVDFDGDITESDAQTLMYNIENYIYA